VLHTPTVIIPIRNFAGMSRLSAVLTTDERNMLALELATRAVTAAHAANLGAAVVSSSPNVVAWSATVGADSWPDSGEGLSAAAHGAVAALIGAPWIMLHADLPLVNAPTLKTVADASASGTVLVPSHDGGTNVIASSGAFPFAYGPGSFHRHFAAVPGAMIISNPSLSIDIDTSAQLSSFPELLNVSTLGT
jgi:2-phospho-L-lactate guanylyltransferase